MAGYVKPSKTNRVIKIATDFKAMLPNFSGMEMDYSTFIQKLMWIILIGMLILIIFKFSQYRLLVKSNNQVKDGYVVKNGRYRKKKDKDGKEYLQPMFGKNNLPSFPNQCWQKVNGLPFFGIRRVINVIRLNEYSFKVLYPPTNSSNIGISKYYDSLTWVYLEQDKKFVAKMKRGSWVQMLGIAAPSFIIIVWAIILAVAMWGEATRNQQAAEAINQVTNILKGIIEGKG